MATTLPKSSSTQVHEAHSRGTRPPGSRPPSNAWVGKLLALTLVLLILGAALYGAGRYLPRWGQQSKSTGLLYAVERGDLLVTVTEDGNLESASNIEIKCQVAGGSSILWIVDDG